jgi:hypothetical protein
MVLIMKKSKSNASNENISPALKLRDTDLKYTGEEPEFMDQPDERSRKFELIKSFNWYNYYFDRKMAKDLLIEYVEKNFTDTEAKKLKAVSDREVNIPICWLSRLSFRGLSLTEQERTTIHKEVSKLINLSSPVEVPDAVKSTRPNVQEIMRERAQQAAGDIEGMFDESMATATDTAIIRVLTEYNVLPQHIGMINDIWTARRKEFEEALGGRDPQLKEGYSHCNKTAIKNMIKFCDTVISGVSGYVTVKKSTKAPRPRKAISPEKQASKIKYLKEYKELGLKSVPPSKLIGATEVWMYDTEKRKLHYYIADSHVGSMSVKGTTILGFDSTNSGVKTIRKPQDFFKAFMTAGKPAARKLFKDLSTVQTEPNGRTNENLIILKAY